MKILITGITGFVGSHLAEHLLAKGDTEVFGIRRWRSRLENIEGILKKVALFECDMKDASSIRKILSEIRPDRIYHLAAQSFVPASWSSPGETLTTNIIGQLNLFEAMRDLGLGQTRVQIAGSSEEYGMVYEKEVPILQSNPLRPLSPYAVSKVTQDLMAYQYFHSYKLLCVRTRAFNHTGPRRGQVFVTSNFAKQIASIEKGLQEPVIRVGNLEAKRDFTDVRDVVRAYVLAVEQGDPGEVYNICSGRSMAIRQMLDILLGMTDKKIAVEPDPARMRPSDVNVLQGDAAKFTNKTGWKPEIPFEKTMKDLLDYWRERVSSRDTSL